MLNRWIWVVAIFLITMDSFAQAENIKEMSMVWIPPGAFLMGSQEKRANELPVKRVYVDGFHLDKFEVTNAHYAEFVQKTGYAIPRVPVINAPWNTWRNGRPPNGMENHPVVGVSWEDANAFCTWQGKRLPTEAEWEKAARGGLEGKEFPCGTEISPAKTNYNAEKTKEVGTYAPNGYGLYDMAGNVWELCSDIYVENDVSPPRYNGLGRSVIQKSRFVVRGGAWLNGSQDIRVTSRYWRLLTRKNNNTGFRCAKD